ncbi:MAG: GGDEF domain-containing phosphodiesterase [Wenzhouxiangella sp.]|jgi:EAL domain-containing protein (putative c-di-GMP-specific phosphodiesterase class I)/GGDEF domain-containing protein|nr:GGDEF domain-containing phosphodiesterase [Wenzhouxiangella sp.]
MNFEGVLRRLESNQALVVRLMLPVILAMIVAVFLLVWFTGGIKYVFSHSMYVPILLAGLFFGWRGGLAAGVIGGVALGPFMPIDVTSGEMQQTLNWVYRLGFFCLIGGLAGAASDSVRWYVRHLRWAMNHDHATGLANRKALIRELEGRCGQAGDAAPATLAMISLENAEELGISFGAGSTDALVGEMASRLDRLTRGELPVYRVSRSRLCLLLEGEDASRDHERIDRLSALFVEPVALDGLSVHVDVRVGLVRLDQPGRSAEQAIRNAETALVLARETSRTSVTATGDALAYSRENVALLGQLWQALQSGQLEMHYQPKVALASGRVTGVEALMRWRHPEQGMIPPGKFIPRAEQSTLIDDLTEFALSQALSDLRKWRDCGMELEVAVNVSARNLAHRGFAEMVRRKLAERELDGGVLELEVTEGALMNDVGRVSRLLATLQAMNVIMSIDDFGTGYSSLKYISDLPVSVIKVDKAFIQPLTGMNGARHIVDATIGLSHRLGMEVVAEGIESSDALEVLGEMHCDRAQGYYIARPMPADEFRAWFGECRGEFPTAPAA